MKFMAPSRIAAVIMATGFGIASAQVPFNRLLNAQSDSQNWLTYNGNLKSTHYSMLDQINPGNVANLDLKWVYQVQSLEKFEATPLVVDGVMYVSEPPNNVAAIDTRTGRPYWVYERPMPETTYVCCGNINRGLAILGHTLFMGTIDGNLIAVDARDGRLGTAGRESADRRPGPQCLRLGRRRGRGKPRAGGIAEGHGGRPAAHRGCGLG